jgi:ABC-type transport system involved in multi-copper enzyme maturation permease subunit
MEWIKLRSLRSTWLTLAIAVAASAGIALATGSSTTSGGMFVGNTLVGMLVGVLLIGVVGVLAMTSEYTSGTIRATFAAAPRRLRVLAAKAAVVGAVALITGEAAAFLSFFAGCMTLRHGITAPALSQPGVLRAIVLTGASLSLIGLLGLGLGAIIRHTAAAITVVVGIVCAGGPLNLAIRPYLPIYIVSHSLSATTPLCVPGAASCWLSAWSGLGMLAIYAAIAMVLGALILARRDA